MHRLSVTLALSLFLVSASIALAHDGSAAVRVSCVPTQPNGYTPPGAHASPNNHGADGLWLNLWTATAGAAAWEYDARDHLVSIKYGWVTPQNVKPIITGRRTDAPAPLLVADVGALAWDDGDFFPSLLYFATRGCWQITATAGGVSITFVVEVPVGPEAWKPPHAPSARARIWGGRNVTFEWPQGDCRSFDIATKRGSRNWRVVRVATSTIEYTLYRAAPGTRYALRLRCRDMFGSSGWGGVVTARVPR